jgi:hypothetical protein
VHAVIRVGESATNSGVADVQTSLAAGQRGAKAQPIGRFTGETGAPEIDASREPDAMSSRGIDRNKPIVYGIAGLA